MSTLFRVLLAALLGGGAACAAPERSEPLCRASGTGASEPCCPGAGGQPVACSTVGADAGGDAGDPPDTGPPMALGVWPTELTFSHVKPGEVAEQTVEIANTRFGILPIAKVTLSGTWAFSAVLDDGDPATPPLELGPPGDMQLDYPVVLYEGEKATVTVRFAPSFWDESTGTLTVHGLGPSIEEVAQVSLRGNVGEVWPLRADPEEVDFGTTPVGDMAARSIVLWNTGDEPVPVTSIALDPMRSSPSFSLDLEPLQGSWDGEVISAQSPLVIPEGEAVLFHVRYAPSTPSWFDLDDEPAPELGFVRVENHQMSPPIEVALWGTASDPTCPVATIEIAEGDEVAPNTLLHLRGDTSVAPTGSIAAWQWSVSQPYGSQSVFLPSATDPNPTFEVQVGGSYGFGLSVWDEHGNASCVPAGAVVNVQPAEALFVELSWYTPGDPDPTDEGPGAGADLDLHLLHPDATGPDRDGDGTPDGWFDDVYDCCWSAPSPSWGTLDPTAKDDPHLDHDAVTGPGPEAVVLASPQGGATYQIGVHAWDDHGHGPSYASLRVYVHRTLVFELTDVKLSAGDLWHVASFDWPSGEVTLVTDTNGNYRITPGVVRASFPDKP